jgi:hypothetical protein
VVLRGERAASQVLLEVWETGPEDRPAPPSEGPSLIGVEGLVRQMGARLETISEGPTRRCFRMLIPA